MVFHMVVKSCQGILFLMNLRYSCTGAYEPLKENETYTLPIPGVTTIQITLAIALHKNTKLNLVILKLYI